MPTVLRSVVRLRLLVAASALALLLAGGLAVVRPPAAAQAQAHAQAFTWHAGYSVQAGWLCYGTSAALHCTQHWSLVAGRYVSGNPTWVPSQGSASSSGTPPLAYVTQPAGSAAGVLAGDVCPSTSRAVWGSFNEAGSAWQIPPGCLSGVFSPTAAAYFRPAVPWGQCSWWPSALRRVPGPASLPYHHSATVHSIAYWSPAMNPGGSTAHYGFVESISPDGRWLLTSEMNMYWRGGGFGRVVFVYRPVAGVTGFYG